MDDNYILDLLGALDQNKSKKQVNADIKTLEKTINMLRLTATFAKADTKRELNAYIKQLSNQLSTIKLKAQIDSKNLKSEVNKALNNVSFKDIDALNIDENKTKLKVQKVISDTKAFVEKNPIVMGINISSKKNKLDNDLTTYLNRNSKINESRVLLQEANKVRDLIDAITDKKSLTEATDAFRLFKSEVSATGYTSKSTADKVKSMLSHITKIGSAFGVASILINSFTKSLKTLRGNDTILTEISKTSELTKQQLKELGDAAFKIASKYGQLSSSFLLATQEMARAGYDDNVKVMAELSTKVQGAGDMTAELSNQYIIATDKAFKMNGSIETLTATLDGANNITNNNALSMSDLAEAMSIVGSQAASAGMEVNETTAAVSTMIAVTQRSGSEMANAFKGILMNLQQVSGDVGDGEDIIDSESLTKYEKACAELGVSLSTVKDGIVSLKEPMQIIKELAEAYTQLDEADARRANLLSAVGGKYRANALNAILENYDMYEKMLKEYADGLGSMDKEAEKTAKSWEGRLNSLQNSWDSFINTLTNKEAIMGGISFIDRLIQGAEKLTDSIGEIPVVLTTLNTAMAIMRKDYGITNLFNPETKKLDVQGNIFGIDFTNIKNLKKHYEEAGEAIIKWNKELKGGKVDIEAFNDSVVQNNVQLKEYLSTCSKDAPASLSGYKEYLNKAGVATDALRLKTILLNSAITLGIGIAIQLAVTAIDNYIHRLDNAKEALSNTQSELSSVSREIEDTTDKIKELEALDPSSLSITDKEDLQRLKDQNEELRIRQQYLEQQEKYDLQKVADLTKEKYGQKYGNTNRELVDAYKSLYENKSTQSEPASSYLTGGNSSIQAMPYAASKQDPELLRGSEVLADLIAQYEYYSEAKKEAIQNEDAESIEKYNNKLIELSQKLRDDRKELQGFADDLSATGEPSKELDDIKSQLKMIDDLLVSPGQNLANFINDASLADTKQQLIDLADAGKLTQDELTANFSEVDDYLKQNGLTLEDLISIVKTYKEELSETQDIDISPTLSLSETINQLNTQIKPAFDALKSAWQDIFADDEFKLNSIDIISTCDSIKAKLDEMSELGLDVDYSAYEHFIDILNSSDSTVDDVKEGFNQLATSITQAGVSGAEDFETMKAALEDLGVINEELVAFDALISNTEALKEAGLDLASATDEQIAAFANEIISTENVSQAIAMLTFQKELCGLQDMNTAGEVANLLTLAENAGYTGDVIEQLTELEKIYQQVASGTLTPRQLDAKLARAAELETAIKESASNIKYEPKVDFSGATKSAKSAGKEAGDQYLKAFQEEYSHLKDQLDRGEISELQYLNALRALYIKYFKDRKKYLDEFKKYESEYVSGMVDLHNKALSGISTLLNRKISAANDAKDAAVDALKVERDAAIEAREAEKERYEQEIKLIDKKIKAKEKVIEGIRDEIDALEEANRQKDRENRLALAKYNLERIMNQRTILQYSESRGMHYVQDLSAARSAKDDVDSTELEIEIANKEKEIKLIEKEIDLLEEKKDSINEQIALLDDQIDQINKVYDNLIDEQEKYWDSMVKNMEQQKSRWEEIAEVKEIAEAFSYIQQVFGDLGYTVDDVLNGNEQAFEDFKSKYISLLSDMNNNSSFAEGLTYATGVAEENLGSFLGKTQEAGTGIDELASKASELGTVAESMDKLSDSATTASEGTSATASSMSELSTSTEGLSESLTSINDALADIPETDKLDHLTTSFTNLGDAIQAVADVLGIGEDGAVSTLVSALQEISTLSLDGSDGKGGSGSGIISQFQTLKTAVDEVTNAISGGGSSGNTAGGDASTSSSPSMSAGAGGDGANGLVGAIGDIKSVTDESLGGGEGSENGAIPQFQELRTAVDDVTAAIGVDEAENGEVSENTLISALRTQYDTASEVLPEEKALFEELLESIMSCVNALNSMVSMIGSIPEVGGFSGISVTPHAKGTVGNAHANGTNYKGLPTDEKNALVSEYGQTEMTVLPNGKTIITDEPTMMDLPKDTVIFNEEQTKKIMDNKVDASGNAYASGTSDGSWIGTDGHRYRDIQPRDRAWELQKAFEPMLKRWKETGEEISNAYIEGQRRFEKWTKEITNNTAISNITNNNKPTVTIGDIHVTCPGVTEQQVAEQLGTVIGKELDKQFNGFHNYTDQRSRIR